VSPPKAPPDRNGTMERDSSKNLLDLFLTLVKRKIVDCKNLVIIGEE
jgi:hypothetical protein